MNLGLENANTTKDISVDMAECIEKASIINIVKHYVNYLKQNSRVSTKEEAVDTIGKICSPAVDRGVISIANVDEIINWVKQEPIFFEATAKAHATKEAVTHAFEQISVSTTNENEDFKRLADLTREVRTLSVKLANAYGEYVKSYSTKFLKDFGGQFDPAFVESESKLFN